MVTRQAIEYEVDGTTMVGVLAADETLDEKGGASPRPGVVLFHEGGGQDENVRSRAERLAALGYIAFAADYFGGGQQFPLDRAQARLGELMSDPDQIRGLARAGLDTLLADSRVDAARVGAFGYCFGGTMALELGRSGADLRAIVGFHPGLGTKRPEDSRNIVASVLMLCGADDPILPPETRQAFENEMREAGVTDWRLELYGGVGHSFTNPDIDARGLGDAFRYNRRADERSWASATALLAECFDAG
jgi:dienelactone hydrolase